MLSKIGTGLVSFLAAALAVEAVDSRCLCLNVVLMCLVIFLVSADATASTSSSPTSDDADRSIDFWFGSADVSLAFGTAKITIQCSLPADGADLRRRPRLPASKSLESTLTAPTVRSRVQLPTVCSRTTYCLPQAPKS
ncbi:hypothetical protein BJ742DRAFT_837620 [Cladochytrium replicatum]|nr:hypothetical protein BJ742DRAFT_837620 [Cladochytrium replicatum]